MRIYLDMCCLKRPFDDQTQARIHLESEAVLTLLNSSHEKLEFVRSAALELENDQNPLPQRASKVRTWLDSLPYSETADAVITPRVTELMASGFKNFDAFHLACAEAGRAEFFCTCDDRLLAAARRNVSMLKMRVVNPIELLKEIVP